ncbi:MAG: hypothetical protein AAF399_21460, partial [Bacteroidota bacterium]
HPSHFVQNAKVSYPHVGFAYEKLYLTVNEQLPPLQRGRLFYNRRLSKAPLAGSSTGKKYLREKEEVIFQVSLSKKEGLGSFPILLFC